MTAARAIKSVFTPTTAYDHRVRPPLPGYFFHTYYYSIISYDIAVTNDAVHDPSDGERQTMRSVTESLEYFLKPEVLDGDNQYCCQACDKKVFLWRGKGVFMAGKGRFFCHVLVLVLVLVRAHGGARIICGGRMSRVVLGVNLVRLCLWCCRVSERCSAGALQPLATNPASGGGGGGGGG